MKTVTAGREFAVVGVALIARAKWIAIVRRVEQTAYPYEGWETAAPPLE